MGGTGVGEERVGEGKTSPEPLPNSSDMMLVLQLGPIHP